MVSRVIFALLFVAWVGEWPREIDTAMYHGLWRSPFEIFGPLFSPLPGIRMFTWQLLLIGLVPICLAMPGAFRRRAREMDVAILVSLACVAITFLWGWMRGGAPYQAYYQLWRFLTGLLVGFLLLCAIQSGRDLRALALTIVVAALIRGTLVIYYYWAHVYDQIFPTPDYMTNHDDSLLFVAAILVAWTWAILGSGRGRRVAAAVVTAHLFCAVVLNGRRIAWLELLMALVAIYVLIGSGALRRRINRWLIVLGPVILVYGAVGWNQESALFAPVHALSSAGSDYDPSSLARQEENRNILYTMSATGNPVLGTGWGVPYQKLTSIYNQYAAEWVLAFYTPHNSLLGLALFAGFLGIAGIWCVVPVAAYLAACGYRRTMDPTLRTAALVAVGILTAYGVHCYGDIGLQSFPCGLFLGVALATAAKVAAWSAAPAGVRSVPTPVHLRTEPRGPRQPVSAVAPTRAPDRPVAPRTSPASDRREPLRPGGTLARRPRA